jgi:hypothetical protein
VLALAIRVVVLVVVLALIVLVLWYDRRLAAEDEFELRSDRDRPDPPGT